MTDEEYRRELERRDELLAGSSPEAIREQVEHHCEREKAELRRQLEEAGTEIDLKAAALRGGEKLRAVLAAEAGEVLGAAERERDAAKALAGELAERLEGLLIATAPGLTTHLDHEKDEARALLSRTKASCLTGRPTFANAATRFVAPEQNQQLGESSEGQGKPNAPGGKSND